MIFRYLPFLLFLLSGCTSIGVQEAFPQKEYARDPAAGESQAEGGQASSLTFFAMDGEANSLSAVQGDRGPVTQLRNPRGVVLTPFKATDDNSEGRVSAPLNVDLEALESRVHASQLSAAEFILLLGEEVLNFSVYLEDGVVSPDAVAPSIAIPANASADVVLEFLKEFAASLGLSVDVRNKSLVVSRQSAAGAPIEVGIGDSAADVPQTSGTIYQIVPVKNRFDIEIDQIVGEIAGLRVSRSVGRNAYIFSGPRLAIIRGLELVSALDTPAIRGQHIRLFKPALLSPLGAARDLQTVLEAEGIGASVFGGRQDASSPVVMVALDRMGFLIIFSNKLEFIERAAYWLEIVDSSEQVRDDQFFIYQPKNTSAGELAAGLRLLFSAAGATEEARVPGGDPSTAQAPNKVPRTSFTLLGVKVVEEPNTGGLLIFGTASDYEKLVPILSKMDVAPKQVLLDVVIAELSMKDEFKYGLEWALSNRGIKVSTLGGFGATSFSGLSVAVAKDKTLAGTLTSSSGLVKVLSNPSLLVQEGEDASVSVGSRISVVGQTTFDPLVGGQRQTTAAEYIDTGVNVSFKPTLLGSDVVKIEITQSISNTVAGTAGAAGNPDIFDRAVTTSVLSRSGQSVLLGGLISDRAVNNNDGLPKLSKIPFLGGLFGAQSRQAEKTELVMMVTPRVLEDPKDWEQILEGFGGALRTLIDQD